MNNEQIKALQAKKLKEAIDALRNAQVELLGEQSGIYAQLDDMIYVIEEIIETVEV